MNTYEGTIQILIDELAQLPGVGPKGAQRIAFFLLKVPNQQVDSLTQALALIKEVNFCEKCFMVSAAAQCRICLDASRDRTKVCVVEEPKDVLAIERTNQFFGLYHVLGGSLNPMQGIGPEQLRIKQLLQRLGEVSDPNEMITEVILASDPDTEGEATATFLARTLKDFTNLKITRLAAGLPMGGELEFADELTLGQALSGRRAVFD